MNAQLHSKDAQLVYLTCLAISIFSYFEHLPTVSLRCSSFLHGVIHTLHESCLHIGRDTTTGSYCSQNVWQVVAGGCELKVVSKRVV